MNNYACCECNKETEVMVRQTLTSPIYCEFCAVEKGMLKHSRKTIAKAVLNALVKGMMPRRHASRELISKKRQHREFSNIYWMVSINGENCYWNLHPRKAIAYATEVNTSSKEVILWRVLNDVATGKEIK